jgi:hypothetical protein
MSLPIRFIVTNSNFCKPDTGLNSLEHSLILKMTESIFVYYYHTLHLSIMYRWTNELRINRKVCTNSIRLSYGIYRHHFDFDYTVVFLRCSIFTNFALVFAYFVIMHINIFLGFYVFVLLLMILSKIQC